MNILIPLLDHMLNLFAFHGQWTWKIKAKAISKSDYHTYEDRGITLARRWKKALGDKKESALRRATIPMDESLATVVIDISGRPYLVYNVKPPKGA